MTERAYMIRLPWPPTQLTPNFKRRNHWRKYAPFIKHYRNECWGETLRVTGARPSGLSKPLYMSIHFYPPDRRHRDDDGMIGAFKAGRDGMSDALGVDDKHFKPSYHVEPPLKGGCVLVQIHAVKPEHPMIGGVM